MTKQVVYREPMPAGPDVSGDTEPTYHVWAISDDYALVTDIRLPRAPYWAPLWQLRLIASPTEETTR